MIFAQQLVVTASQQKFFVCSWRNAYRSRCWPWLLVTQPATALPNSRRAVANPLISLHSWQPLKKVCMVVTHLGPMSLEKMVVTHTMSHQSTRGSTYPWKFYWFPHSHECGKKKFGSSGAWFTDGSCSSSGEPFVGKPVPEGDTQGTYSGGPLHSRSLEICQRPWEYPGVLHVLRYSWMEGLQTDVSHNCEKSPNRWKPDQ